MKKTLVAFVLAAFVVSTGAFAASSAGGMKHSSKVAVHKGKKKGKKAHKAGKSHKAKKHDAAADSAADAAAPAPAAPAAGGASQ